MWTLTDPLELLQLATLYKAVVGTDTSTQQLAYATRLRNVRYVHVS